MGERVTAFLRDGSLGQKDRELEPGVKSCLLWRIDGWSLCAELTVGNVN